MNKIATFSQIDFDTDWDNVDTEALRAEIDTFTTEMLARAEDQLHNWFGLVVTASLLKQVLKANLNLAWETYTGGISDTCQRSLLIDALLKEIGHSRGWPINAESNAAQQAFFDELDSIINSRPKTDAWSA